MLKSASTQPINAVPEASSPEIINQIERLHRKLEMAHDSVSLLVSRLSVVLEPEAPCAEAQIMEPMGTVLGEQLQRAVLGTDALTSRLDSITSRLGI